MTVLDTIFSLLATVMVAVAAIVGNEVVCESRKLRRMRREKDARDERR